MKVGKWESGKVGKWESGKVGNSDSRRERRAGGKVQRENQLPMSNAERPMSQFWAGTTKN
jgi:hypothetical protein